MKEKTIKITMTALMAALCYIAFTFLQIKIQTPVGATSFHLGNVFCVLAALLIDGVSGGIAGAIGMGIGDLLDPFYIVTAPKTIFLKFFIGYITGLVAHKVFHIKEKKGKELLVSVFISVCVGMLFNIIGEPTISYLYYQVILNNSDKALSYLNITKWITTSVNSIITIVLSTILYVSIVKRIKVDK